MHTVCTRRLEQEAAIDSENHLHMYYWKIDPSIQYFFTVKRVSQQAGSEDHLQYLQKNSLSICTQKDSNNQ